MVMDLYKLSGNIPIVPLYNVVTAVIESGPDRLRACIDATKHSMNDSGISSAEIKRITWYPLNKLGILAPQMRGVLEETGRGRDNSIQFKLTSPPVAISYMQKMRDLIGVLNGS